VARAGIVAIAAMLRAVIRGRAPRGDPRPRPTVISSHA